MPDRFVVSRSDFTFEALYQRADLNVFGRSQTELLTTLFDTLGPHGLKLSDMKLERGTGTLGELHVLCANLANYVLAIRVRIDRVEATCSFLTVQNRELVYGAIADALKAVRTRISSDYHAFSLSLNLHGIIESLDSKKYLAGYVEKRPDMGPIAGTAVAFYFGPAEDRLSSTLTLDVSAVVPGALYVRPQATWDAGLVTVERLQERAVAFVRSALLSVGLELPE